MQAIVIGTVVVAVIGLLIGLMLIAVGSKFKVEVDEREAQVRECLPGNNCGACGYAGCDAMAGAIAQGEAPVNGCPVGGAPVAEKIGRIMGVEAGAIERNYAYVKCSGSCDFTSNAAEYVGIKDCSAAVTSGIAPTSCDYGCLGFGSCVAACQFDAIHVVNGVAKVDRSKCVACGKCVAACPRHLIELVPEKSTFAVACSNKDKGPQVKKVCSTGCIGCRLCVKQCESEAITVEDNVAHIDYEKCIGCGKCAEKCPSKVIHNEHIA